MNQWKRLLFYVGLNIVVSACTTLAVLWFWDRAHPEAPMPGLAALAAQPTQSVPAAAQQPSTQPATSPEPSQTPLPNGELPRLIVIDNVFGVGNLGEEFVLLKRIGDGELNMTGWKLEDGQGDAYTFPTLTLYNLGAVQVHTAAGQDSVVDLYWGRDAPVWAVGKTVRLVDAQGNTRATYQIP